MMILAADRCQARRAERHGTDHAVPRPGVPEPQLWQDPVPPVDRIRLAPQRQWEVNEPAELGKALQALEKIQQTSTGRSPMESGSHSPI
jgi:hypothetical protein